MTVCEYVKNNMRPASLLPQQFTHRFDQTIDLLLCVVKMARDADESCTTKLDNRHFDSMLFPQNLLQRRAVAWAERDVAVKR